MKKIIYVAFCMVLDFSACDSSARRQAKTTAVVSEGHVSGITITDGGTGYASAPVVSFFSGGGAGAEALALITNGVVGQILG
jgi:hypothetical protein